MEKVNIGDRIELSHTKSKNGLALSTNKYISQLVDYDGSRKATIMMPIFEGRMISLQIGDEYSLTFFTSNGFRQCNAVITKRYVSKKIFLVDCLFISPMKRSQRREYYRLECLFDVRFRLVSEYEKILRARMLKHDFAEEEAYNDASDELAAMRSQWEEGLASDISGGGMCLHGRVSYDPDDELELELLLPMDNKIVHTEVMLRVVRCADKEENRFRYEIRGEFIDLDNSKRELIVRYVFQEQRKRLGKL